MSAACILLALSAVIGLVLSPLTRWPAIVACDVILAGLFSMVLQIEGFRTITGIAIITVCLTISQVAYLIGLVKGGSRNNIAGKNNSPISVHLTRLEDCSEPANEQLCMAMDEVTWAMLQALPTRAQRRETGQCFTLAVSLLR
jgi:hypothetical protein